MSGNTIGLADSENNYIESEEVQELLGITTDSKLMFENLILINFAKREAKH